MNRYKNQPLKFFSSFQQVPKSLSIISDLINGFGIEIKDFPKCSHPREDFYKISKKYPIFAVADGVTLELDKKGRYPNPSGSAAVAKLFCEHAVKEMEQAYVREIEPDVKRIFSQANSEAGKYNAGAGRVKGKLNYTDFDLFAATGAVVVVKDGTVYWTTICDSSILRLNENGELIFRSPDGWDILKKNLPKNWLEIPTVDRKKIIREKYRNGVDKNGRPIGYGVITGEKNSEKYLNFGKFTAAEGDVIFLITDGFENYFGLKNFVKLFLDWPKDLKSKFKKLTGDQAVADPDKFGRERTLIAIKFESQ